MNNADCPTSSISLDIIPYARGCGLIKWGVPTDYKS